MPSTTEAAALIPDGWREQVSRLPAEGGPSGATWAAGLPRLLADLLDHWGLSPTGTGMTGWTAVVVPVTREGDPLVLKVVWPHHEAAAEPLALRHWAGNGAVRLVAAEPSRGGLLLEALDPTTDLRCEPVEDACEVIGGLLRRLHVPAPPRVRTLSDWLERQLGRLPQHADTVPRRMLDQAESLMRQLATVPEVDGTLLHTDLHFQNVLAAGREPWLAIDPKPLAGRPGFELPPVLWNRLGELGTGSAFRWSVRRRLQVVCEAAGIDEDEARAWVVVRETAEAMSAADDGDRDALTLAISLAKAMDD
ncbi:streptomycin 6-kinase [Pedococcus cremeus]|uniref:Streptomycin 6-kinase n=1 Tax=Pedococcus cremeus TaxID=587636 RepID=A0A1H9QWC1_9MICO|nr:aminoglycoside phosphotransferase family protein [Pedococcus cremeus]SER64697.1 streptomycin 6-kinase [Pedococcus cremeus]